jgi:hypothetical protein
MDCAGSDTGILPVSPCIRTGGTPVPLVRGHMAPEFLFFRLARFVGEHSVFRRAGTFSFLAAGFFDARSLGIGSFAADGFDFIQQQFPGDEAVHALLAGFLAFHLNAAGAMQQHDTGGNFVDVLPAMAAGANEGFLNIALAQAEGGHALGQLIFLVETDGERAHGCNVAADGDCRTSICESGHERKKLQAHQATSSREAPSFKRQKERVELGAWYLKVLWSLVLGFWNFGASLFISELAIRFRWVSKDKNNFLGATWGDQGRLAG